jgi:hypothetical protein
LLFILTAHTTILPPITNELTIAGIAAGTQIQMFDVLGRRVVDTKTLNAKETINTAALMPGTYLLKLSNSKDERMSAKVVKE